MRAWILICRKCKIEFQHSQISDVGMASLYDPPKPIVPPTVNECVCRKLRTQRGLPTHRFTVSGLKTLRLLGALPYSAYVRHSLYFIAGDLRCKLSELSVPLQKILLGPKTATPPTGSLRLNFKLTPEDSWRRPRPSYRRTSTVEPMWICLRTMLSAELR